MILMYDFEIVPIVWYFLFVIVCHIYLYRVAIYFHNEIITKSKLYFSFI